MTQRDAFDEASLTFVLSRFGFDEATGVDVVFPEPQPSIKLTADGERGNLTLVFQMSREAFAGLLAGEAADATLDPDALHWLYTSDGDQELTFAPTTLSLTPIGPWRFHVETEGEARTGDDGLWRYVVDLDAELTEVDSEGHDRAEAEASLQALWPDWRTVDAVTTGVELTFPTRYVWMLLRPDTAPEGESAPLELVDTTGWDTPSDACPLVLEGRARAVESARLSFGVVTEHWSDEQQAWLYGKPELQIELNLHVDEASGEDGAPAPELSFWLPVVGSWRRLFDITLNDADYRCEAWYGNDAPSLFDNTVTLRERTGDQCRARWEAKYAEMSGIFPLLFDGVVHVGPLSLAVRNREDADAMLDQVFPDGSWREWEGPEVTPVDYGENLPPERRHWLALVYRLPD